MAGIEPRLHTFSVPRKPFGVWFSLILTIFFVGLVLGRLAGVRSGAYWARHEIRRDSRLAPAAQKQLEAELIELEGLSVASCVAELIQPAQINHAPSTRPTAAIESIAQTGEARALAPVAQFELALARLDLADEYRAIGNSPAADREFATAQDILRSLGWQDVSSATLEAVTKRETCRRREQTPQNGEWK